MHIVLTGVTGFVGRAVLMRIMTDTEELSNASLSVLIRDKRNINAATRFAVVKTDVIKALEATNPKVNIALVKRRLDAVQVVQADLTQAAWIEAIPAPLLAAWTHFVLCAASVEFNHPAPVAFRENVVSLYVMLQAARRCGRPIHVVYISTAYVCSPSDTAYNQEVLQALPPTLEEQWPTLIRWVESMGTLKWELGAGLDRFPNTYTLSKCTAERFLSRQSYAQLASISIVRPSIVGASVCFPFPAWYHGHAAYLGLASIMMSRIMPVLPTTPHQRCNIIPIDLISYAILQAVRITPTTSNVDISLSSATPFPLAIIPPAVSASTTAISSLTPAVPALASVCPMRIWNATVPESHTISVWLSMKIGERIIRLEHARSASSVMSLLWRGGSLEMESTVSPSPLQVYLIKWQAARKRLFLRGMATVTKNQAGLKALDQVEDAPRSFLHFLTHCYLFTSSLHGSRVWLDWSVEKFYHDMNYAVWKKLNTRRSNL